MTDSVRRFSIANTLPDRLESDNDGTSWPNKNEKEKDEPYSWCDSFVNQKLGCLRLERVVSHEVSLVVNQLKNNLSILSKASVSNDDNGGTFNAFWIHPRSLARLHKRQRESWWMENHFDGQVHSHYMLWSEFLITLSKHPNDSHLPLTDGETKLLIMTSRTIALFDHNAHITLHFDSLLNYADCRPPLKQAQCFFPSVPMRLIIFIKSRSSARSPWKITSKLNENESTNN